MIAMAFGSASLFRKAPYVQPNPLLLNSDALVRGSVGAVACAADLVSANANFSSAVRSQNHNAGEFGFARVREWPTEADLIGNLTVAERLRLGRARRHGSGNVAPPEMPSCGGIVRVGGGAARQEANHPDTTGLAWFDDGALVVAANSSLVASLPVFLSLWSNAVLLQQFNPLAKAVPSETTVTVMATAVPTIATTNHPLPYTVPQVVDTTTLFLPMFAGMGFLGVGLGGLALVEDRETRRRHVLHLRGLQPYAYIAGHLLFDVGVMGLPLLAVATSLIFVFDAHWLMGSRLPGWLALGATSVFGTATLGYLGSHAFRTASMAGRVWPAVLPALTVIPFIVVFVLESPENMDGGSGFLPQNNSASAATSSSAMDPADMISLAFCVVPPFALQEGVKRLMKLGVEAESARGGAAAAVEVVRDVFALSSRRGVLFPILMSGGFGVLAFLAVLSFERGNGGSDCRAPCRPCDCGCATCGRKRVEIAEQPGHCTKDRHTSSRRRPSGSQPHDGQTLPLVAADEDVFALHETRLRVHFVDSDEEDEDRNSASRAGSLQRGGARQSSWRRAEPSARTFSGISALSENSGRNAGISVKALQKVYRSTGSSFSAAGASVPSTARSSSSASASASASVSSATTSGEIAAVSSTVRAVENLSLEVRRGELVALLGPNGAGKTTTMSILATETMATSGIAWVAGQDLSLASERERLRRGALLGFCPQFDALFGSLTVREHLHLWAAVQGVLQKSSSASAGADSMGGEALAQAIGLGSYLDVRAAHLSGGNKRKLSVALALLGSPDVLLLDEPSTGVDVAARREVWDLLSHFRETAAVLLSTHSMEEAVALGDRIAVMVAGSCAAEGTTSQLQHAYGAGYVLEVSANEGCGDRVERFLTEKAGAVLKERFCDELKFSVDPQRVPLADAFDMMSELTERDGDAPVVGKKKTQRQRGGPGGLVKYYSIAHSTMQDVFMTILLRRRKT